MHVDAQPRQDGYIGELRPHQRFVEHAFPAPAGIEPRQCRALVASRAVDEFQRVAGRAECPPGETGVGLQHFVGIDDQGVVAIVAGQVECLIAIGREIHPWCWVLQ
jgi:hypothetical protein